MTSGHHLVPFGRPRGSRGPGWYVRLRLDVCEGGIVLEVKSLIACALARFGLAQRCSPVSLFQACFFNNGDESTQSSFCRLQIQMVAGGASRAHGVQQTREFIRVCC